MTKRGRYAKLMGEFWRDPRAQQLSSDAVAFWCRCLSYCADNMTDGLVPKFMGPALLPGMGEGMGNPMGDPLRLPRAVALLTAHGDGEKPWIIEHADTYEVVGYCEHNITSDEWKRRVETGRKSAAKRWKKGGAHPPLDGSPNGSPNGFGNADPGPKTSRVKIDPSLRSGSAGAREVRGKFVQAFERAYHDATGKPWMRASQFSTQLDTIAEWLAACDEPAAEQIPALIEGFLSDDWCAGKDYPLTALAKQPGRYLGDSKAKRNEQATERRRRKIARLEESLAEVRRWQKPGWEERERELRAEIASVRQSGGKGGFRAAS